MKRLLTGKRVIRKLIYYSLVDFLITKYYIKETLVPKTLVMKKANMTLIDVTEFPDPLTEAFIFMSDEEEEQMDIYCEFVQLGTSAPTGTKLNTGFYCRQEMEDGEFCDGAIDVTQIDLPKQVRWKCRRCGDTGALINYEGTMWDNSHLVDEEKERFIERFFADIEGEDYWEDDFLFEFGEDLLPGPFDDFEYYLNPYDPDGEQSGGPSSERIKEMLECNWLRADSPIYLKGDLPKEDVEQSFFFYNARRFLILLNEEGTFPLSRTGNMKRKVVRRLLHKMRWPGEYIDNIRSYNTGMLDETDVWLLHGIRVLLTLSGLVLEEGDDAIEFNEDYEYLLEDENAGELYQLLFSTYFKDMNLGYLGSTFELPQLQYSVPFILYRLKEYAREWVSVEELIYDILLFTVKLELQFGEAGGIEIEQDLLHEDLFAALERFSVLESRPTSSSADPYDTGYPDQVRITSLFNQFVQV